MCWFSKKQAVMALTLTEAEYIAVTHTVKEVLWVRSFLDKLHVTVADPITLHCNSQSVIAHTRENRFLA